MKTRVNDLRARARRIRLMEKSPDLTSCGAVQNHSKNRIREREVQNGHDKAIFCNPFLVIWVDFPVEKVWGDKFRNR